MGSQLFTASGTFTATVTGTHTIEGIGGGQAGANGGTTNGGVGGRSADYALGTVNLTIGDTVTVTVGGGGTTTAQNGNDSKAVQVVGTVTVMLAKGGGSGSTDVGSTIFTGGTGGGLASAAGGGGASSGGSASNGNNGVAATVGVGGNGGAAVTGGGAGGKGATNGGPGGIAGSIPGGGGGGGDGSIAGDGFGAGARGQVLVSWADAIVAPPPLEIRQGPPLRAPWQPAPYVEQQAAPRGGVAPPRPSSPTAPEIVSGPAMRGTPFSGRLRVENLPGPPAPAIPAATPAMYAAPRRRQIRPFSGSLRPQPPFVLNAQSPQAAGLVSWWPMVGTSANASVDGTAFDYGPRAHDLTVKNASLDTALDLGIVYQNADGIQRYLTAANTADFQITGQVTVAAWVLPFATQPDAYTKILTKGQNKTYTLFLRDNTNPWPAFQITQGGVNAYLVAGSGNYIDTAWHHIVGTYDGAQLRLYVDGLLVASVAASGSIDSTSDDLFIGADNTVTVNLLANVLKGYVGDVRLYSVGKTDREVWQMFDPRTRWDLYRPSRTKSFTFAAAVSATVQSYAPEIVSGPPMRGGPLSARLRIENPPTPAGLPAPPPPTLVQVYAPEVNQGPAYRVAPWLKRLPIEPSGKSVLIVPPVVGPQRGALELFAGPPMRGAPFPGRLPVEPIAPPKTPPTPSQPVMEITGGPAMRGAPWLQHLPIEPTQRLGLGIGPPPRPPGIRDARAKPFIERVPGLEGNRRLERFTEQVSTYVNSMLAQGYLRLVAPGQVQILTGALTGHGPPTSATDVSVGAVPGCPYLDLTNTVVYFCFSNASNAAVWRGPF